MSHVPSSRRTYQRLVESLPDVVFRLDRLHRFTFVSNVVERVIGIAAERIVGERVEDSELPGALCDAITAAAQQASDGPGTSSSECADRGRYFRIRMVRERQHSPALLGVIEDVTAARMRGERRRLQEEVLRALRSAHTTDDVAQAVFDAVHGLGGSSGMLLLRSDAPPFRFDLFHCPDCRTSTRQIAHDLGAGALLPMVSVLDDLQPIWIGSPEEAAQRFPFARPLADESAAPSWACLPLLDGERIIGLLHVSFAEERKFGEEERRQLRTLADECARAVCRTRAEAAERLAAFGTGTEAESRLRQEADILERMVHVVGHDLRSPLSAIILTAEALADEHGTSPAVERIRRSAQRMHRMIGDLLDVARVRHAGGMPIEPRPCDLAELLADQIDELQHVHPDRELQVVSCAEAPGTWDPVRITELMTNLIGNAIQHGQPGPVVITLRCDSVQVELRVGNRGAIHRDELDTLFDPFRSGRGARRGEGLGLGLYISRAIVEAHGGSLFVLGGADSTEFVATLPRTPAAPG